MVAIAAMLLKHGECCDCNTGNIATHAPYCKGEPMHYAGLLDGFATCVVLQRGFATCATLQRRVMHYAGLPNGFATCAVLPRGFITCAVF